MRALSAAEDAQRVARDAEAQAIFKAIELPDRDMGSIRTAMDRLVEIVDKTTDLGDWGKDPNNARHQENVGLVEFLVREERAILRVLAQHYMRQPPRVDADLEAFEAMPEHHELAKLVAGGRLATMDRNELDQTFNRLYHHVAQVGHDQADPSVLAALHLVTRERSNDDLALGQQQHGYGPHAPRRMAIMEQALFPHALDDVPSLRPMPPKHRPVVAKPRRGQALAP